MGFRCKHVTCECRGTPTRFGMREKCSAATTRREDIGGLRGGAGL